MVRLESHMGLIEVSQDYFSEIVGSAVTGCFGVAGIAGGRQGPLRARGPQGVRIYRDGPGLSVDLRILVTYGLNISAVVRSIHSRVAYTVEGATGLEVRKVNVFVDGMLHPDT
ncbi:MAG: Asp23/Gls24 family envelope stress response protein [Oscillospiraceae bacterium]|jgi:uncharacterized alkaline shock family protein YloU|nr:Asp23/Gls24 family envelope stress response protein [Oscillospiraceae bacterium]